MFGLMLPNPLLLVYSLINATTPANEGVESDVPPTDSNPPSVKIQYPSCPPAAVSAMSGCTRAVTPGKLEPVCHAGLAYTRLNPPPLEFKPSPSVDSFQLVSGI